MNIFDLAIKQILIERKKNYKFILLIYDITVEEILIKAITIRKWLDNNPQKAKILLSTEKIKTKQQRYYYKNQL